MDPAAAAAERPPGRLLPSAACPVSTAAARSRSSSLPNAKNALGAAQVGPLLAAAPTASMKNSSKPARQGHAKVL